MLRAASLLLQSALHFQHENQPFTFQRSHLLLWTMGPLVYLIFKSIKLLLKFSWIFAQARNYSVKAQSLMGSMKNNALLCLINRMSLISFHICRAFCIPDGSSNVLSSRTRLNKHLHVICPVHGLQSSVLLVHVEEKSGSSASFLLVRDTNVFFTSTSSLKSTKTLWIQEFPTHITAFALNNLLDLLTSYLVQRWPIAWRA